MSIAYSNEKIALMMRAGVWPYKTELAREIKNAPQGEQRWLDERSHRITATEVANIADYGEKGNAITALKIRRSPIKQTAAMRRGLRDEPAIAERYKHDIEEQTGKTVTIVRSGLIVHPHIPFLGASVDYEHHDSNRKLKEIWEIKSYETIPPQVPPHVHAQVLTQLEITSKSDLVDWGGNPPKAVVIIHSPKTDEIATYVYEWNDVYAKHWYDTFYFKIHMFYFRGVLPKLGPYRYNPANVQPPSLPEILADLALKESAHDGDESESESDEEIEVISPRIDLGKWVCVRGRTKLGEVVRKDAYTGVYVKWLDSKEPSKKSCSEDTLEVLPWPYDKIVRPSVDDEGRRVLICGGKSNGERGELRTYNPKNSNVATSSGEIRVSTQLLHVINKNPVEEDSRPKQELRTWRIGVSGVKDFIKELQMKENFDLVLYKTNDTCRKELFDQKLKEAIEAAGQKEQEENDGKEGACEEEDVVDALLGLGAL